MTGYVVFGPEGKILRSGYCQDNAVHLQPGAGEGVVFGFATDSDSYVDTFNYYTITSFPANHAQIDKITIVADSTDTATITGLPTPCTITVDGASYEVTDGVFEFTVDISGTYKIKAEAFPYLPKEWEITAV